MSEDLKMPFLMASLKETQDTVRSYDTKAQIVGVGYIFAINIIVGFGARIGNMPEADLLVVVLTWLLIITPICLFGAVLYPSRKAAPVLAGDETKSTPLYYADLEKFDDATTYMRMVNTRDLQAEVAYELLRMAGLRDLKRRRFLRALWAATISFLLMFLGQVSRAEGWGQ